MKTIPYNAAAIPPGFTIEYRTRDSHRAYPVRAVEVLASREEIAGVARDGYLVRKNLVPMSQVDRLRAALEETLASDSSAERGGGRAFGGAFIRHMMDKHPVFLELLRFAPALSIARALFGPAVQCRGLTGRVCYPADTETETEWHFHQRVIPAPVPPMFAMPQTIDALLYLDDITEHNGPLCVVPGSHLWLDRDLDREVYGSLPGEVMLRMPAGSLVLVHGSLWHRALPVQPPGSARRLLLWGYGPAWQKPAIYGVKPANGFTTQLLADPECDEETKELLGASGYM